MNLITASNVNTGYKRKQVTKDINFTVSEGDYLCILGENGARKTTLLKTILSLIEPMSGSIECTPNITLGYLPQQTRIPSEFPATGWEVVPSGTISRYPKKCFYGNKHKSIAKTWMDKLSISDLKKNRFGNLSGGQKQRVLLARALCASDKLLVLDEPTKGLDPKLTEEFYEIVENLNEAGTTIIMISHDIEASLKYANNILHIGKRQLYFGSKKEYITSDALSHLRYIEGRS